ncbi:MAG: hypothetical protein R2873_18375, partial [Caldilineaceae bacterium]
VVLGLFLFIGLIAGGTYLLDTQGLISVGGDMPDGPPANMITTTEGSEMPARPERDGEVGGFNAQALMGLVEVLLKMSVVVLVVTGGQAVLSWVQRRRQRAPVALG